MDDLGDLDLNDNQNGDENKNNKSKFSFKDRKLEHKLKKYETILKNLENINLQSNPTKFLFVGNCGLDNNISREFSLEIFDKFGKIVDVVMQKKKPYSFIIYENEYSVKNAIDSLQGKIIEINDSQTPMCYYLLPVDGVPELCELKNTILPDGLIYINDFIDEIYAKEISDFIMNDAYKGTSDLKNRRVKHYGYEFRYGTNDVDETKPLNEKIPTVCDRLLDKCINSGIIGVKPDQLTINFYEPGQGIPPHIDNINAFDDFIISLSLLSSVVMEFRLKQNSNTTVQSLCLKPNSLLVLKSDSRYKWYHSIAERKHDLIRTNEVLNDVTIIKRSLRISLTFRKIMKVSHENKSNKNFIALP